MDMQSKTESNEIFEVFYYLFSKKWLLIVVGFILAISFSIIALLLPKIWESDAILVNVDSGTSTSQSSSAIGGLSQLAELTQTLHLLIR